MRRNKKAWSIYFISIIIFIATSIIGGTIYGAVKVDYNFRTIPSGLLLKQSSPTALIGKVFNNGLDFDITSTEKYLLCVEEYNQNLAGNSNHYWKAARILDFNMGTDHKKPLEATGYASGSNKATASTKLYAKFAAYASWQNSYGIDENVTNNYRTTLKNLIYELKQGSANTILRGYGNSSSGYSGLIGISSPLVNTKFSEALVNYCKFADLYTQNKIFNYNKAATTYENNNIGPFNVALAKDAAKKTVTVPYKVRTWNGKSYTTTSKTQNLTTGVEVTKIEIKLKSGSTVNVSKGSAAKIMVGGKAVDFSTFTWDKTFYINKSGLDPTQISSITLYYKYDLHYARYAIMSGNYASGKYSNQGNMAFQGKKVTLTSTLALTVPKSNVKKGTIKLTKVDKNNNSIKLSGVKFQIKKYDGGKYTNVATITTDSNGYATYSVPLGETYYLQEISASNSKYDYTKIGVKSSSLSGTSIVKLNGKPSIKISGFSKLGTKDLTLTLVLTNPPKSGENPTTSGQILKKCSETGRGVQGARFQLHRRKSHNGEESTLGTSTSDANGYVDFGWLEQTYTYYVTVWHTAWYTDSEGNSHSYSYSTQEPRTGTYSYWAVELSTHERYIFVANTASMNSTVYNTPKKQTIKGRVFEDSKLGKESQYDGIYSGSDTNMSGITVKLRAQDDPGFSRTTTTNSSGEYSFTGLSQFHEYYVEFVYDGQDYMPTKYMEGGRSYFGRNSLAMEDTDERANFNQRFEIINPSSHASVDRKISAYTSIFDDFYLDYEHKSDLGSMMQITSNEIIISGVNLGLARRQKADLAIEKDVYSATVRIKDYEQTYMYNSRRLDSDFSTWDIKDRLNVEGYYSKVYNREIYASDYEYKCEIYNNRGLSIDTDTELKVFITYLLKVKNSSQSIVGKINELVDYYDTDYTYVPEMSYVVANNEEGELETNTSSSFGANNSLSGFKNLYINGLDQYELLSGDSMNLYITFEVNKDQSKNILIDQDLNTMRISTGKENLAEITAFSTYYGANTYLPNYDDDQEGNVAGLLDVDSTPGNLNNSNKYNTSSYEDDTAKAPNITITLSTTVRQINGYVWEDKRTLYNQQYKTNIGDGKRDNGEKLINGVTVQLIENVDGREFIWKTFKTGSTADLSAIFGLKINGKDYFTIKSSDISRGKYIFKSIAPGDYYVKFIYGDSPDTALTTKANWCGVQGLNDTSYNGVDYKSTIYQASSASWSNNNDSRDNLERREDITNYCTLIKNEKANLLNIFKKDVYGDVSKNRSVLNDMMNKTSMYAESVGLDIEVETVNTDCIDLGLTERPKTELVLNKTVENVKVVLSDGTILYDAKDKMSHVLWNTAVEGHKIDTKNGLIEKLNLRNRKGLIQLTVDEEYMKGATVYITYKITVTNNSEYDYDDENFYYKGTPTYTNSIVRTSATKVIDYVANDMGFNQSLNEGWKPVEKTSSSSNLVKDGYIAPEIKDTVNSYNTIIETSDLNKALAPGESISKELVLSKTLGVSQDATSFDNIAEIVETSNQAGRMSVDSVPGDQNPTKDPMQVDAEDSETVTLLTPFGAAKIAAQRALIIVVGLTIVAIGIIVIRKNIIKNNGETMIKGRTADKGNRTK